MPLTTVAAATKILSDAMSALNTVREHAKRSKDTELKQHISTLYDNFLSLKEALMRVSDENGELKRKIAELERVAEKPEPELQQVGAVNYYFVGEKGPYCQPCYDGPTGKLVALSPVENWNDGLRRHCLVCNSFSTKSQWTYRLHLELLAGRMGGWGDSPPSKSAHCANLRLARLQKRRQSFQQQAEAGSSPLCFASGLDDLIDLL